MDNRNIFQEESLNLIEDLENNKYYFVIRENAKYLLSLDEKEFSYDFDYAIAKANCIPVPGINPITGEEVENAVETYFLLYLQYKIIRALHILTEYTTHCDKTGKLISERLEETCDIYIFKRQFLELKFQKLHPHKDIHILKESIKNLGKHKKQSRENLVNGKQLNLLERYEIANKMFGIDAKIRSLKILDTEKYKLLSLIFDCNPTNARHVMNGKYPANVREDLISSYIEDLMK
ncbi:MAG: hypothetical protein ACQEWG_09205 [Bacteroidota bacterium]